MHLSEWPGDLEGSEESYVSDLTTCTTRTSQVGVCSAPIESSSIFKSTMTSQSICDEVRSKSVVRELCVNAEVVKVHT